MKRKTIIIISVLFFLFLSSPELYSQWVQTNGPFGGFATILTTSGSNIFAANEIGQFSNLSGTGSGVFLSSNEGKNWIPVNNGLTEKKITALVALDSYVFAGTQDSGVFLTTTNGANWKSVDHNAFYVNRNGDTLLLKKVKTFATTGTSIYAATDRALFLSHDSGENWQSVNIESVSYQPIQKIVALGEKIFLATNEYVFVSSDNGTSWKSLLQNANILSFAVSGANIYAAGTYSSGGSGNGYQIWVSNDSGYSWVLSKKGLPNGPNEWATSLTVCGANIYLGTNYDGIYRSTDNGANWTQTFLSYTDVRALAVIGADLYAGTVYRGVIVSHDSGASWVEINNGLTLSNVTALTKIGQTLFAGTDGGVGVYRSTNNGIDWIGINNGLIDWQTLSLASNGTDLYYGGSTVYHSNDSGNNWTASKQYFAQVYALAAFDSVIIANVETPLTNIISSDKGKTWNKINSSLGGDFTGAFAQRNKNLYLGTSHGPGTQNWEGVYLSTDNGVLWKQLSTVVNNSAIFSLAIIDSNLFAGTQYGVFLSTNNGYSWTPVNTGFNISHGYRVVALIVSGSNLYAATGVYGTGEGVYMTSNNGKNWSKINQGLLPTDITSLVVTDSNIFAGTLGAGVWRRPLSELGISAVKNSTQSDLNISLSPNPTTGIITVNNAPANITKVTVLNVLGESVLEISPNAAEFTLDLSKLPAGTYFARFVVGGEIVTRKIIRE